MAHTVTSFAGDPTRLARRGAAVLLAACGAGLLVFEPAVRSVEAAISAWLLGATSGRAVAAGSRVYLLHNGTWIGYSVATGCSAALLIAPFAFLGAILLFIGRLRLSRTVLAVLAVAVLVAVVNQLRLLVIGASMGHWGFRTGYDRTHILAGGVLSTVGVALGLALLAWITLRDRRHL